MLNKSTVHSRKPFHGWVICCERLPSPNTSSKIKVNLILLYRFIWKSSFLSFLVNCVLNSKFSLSQFTFKYFLQLYFRKQMLIAEWMNTLKSFSFCGWRIFTHFSCNKSLPRTALNFCFTCEISVWIPLVEKAETKYSDVQLLLQAKGEYKKFERKVGAKILMRWKVIKQLWLDVCQTQTTVCACNTSESVDRKFQCF